MVVDAEQRLMIEAALEKLSPIFREAVVLRDIADMRYENRPEVSGHFPGTVKSRIVPRPQRSLCGELYREP